MKNKTVTINGELFKVLESPDLILDNNHPDGGWYQAKSERVSDSEPCTLEWCLNEEEMNWDEVDAVKYADDEE